MKTEDLVAMLASHAAPTDRARLGRRPAWALAAGVLGALVLLLLRFDPRPDLWTVVGTPLFWARLSLPVLLAAGAMRVAARLSRPGMEVGRRGSMLILPVTVVWLAAAISLGFAPSSERLAMVLGTSWRTCPFNIAYLALPGFVAGFWAMKGMAPTRLRLAGAAAGLLAGAVATAVYCLHCPEMEVAFWAVWYVAGMLIPAAIGAWLGPRFLRW